MNNTKKEREREREKERERERERCQILNVELVVSTSATTTPLVSTWDKVSQIC